MNSKAILESWDHLENLNFSEVFMIVDMQPFFISSFLKSKISDEVKSFYSSLRSNIIQKTEDILENNWIILNVEYALRWGIISELQDVLNNNKEKVVTLRKYNTGLLWDTYGDSAKIEFKKAQDTLEIIQKRDISISIWWIHTSRCVKAVARNVKSVWCKTSVLLGQTLNLDKKATDFKRSNQLSETRAIYWKSSHLLNYWKQPINLASLTDYL